MKLSLTIPPSVNRIWRTVKGRMLKSKEYRDWEKANGWPVKCEWAGVQGKFAGAVRVIVTIRGGKGFPETSDIDNRIKAVLDLLKACDVIQGDTVKHVREVRAVYLPPESKEAVASCEVEIYPVGAPISVP